MKHGEEARLIANVKINSNSSWLNRNVFSIGLTSLLSDMSHETVTVLLPAFLILLGAPVYALGLIEGVSDGLSSFVKLPSGHFSDRLSKRKEIATAGYVVTGVFPAIVAIANSWLVVLVARVFGWLGRGARGPPRDAILAKSVPQKDLGKAFGFHRAGDTLGAIAGPLVAFSLVSYLDFREIFLLTLIPGLLAVFIFWFFTKEKKEISSHEGKPIIISLKRFSSKYKKFIAAVSIFGIADFSHTLLILFAVVTLTPTMGLVKATAAGILLYMIRNVVYALASYPFGALGDRFGKRNVLAFGYALAVLTFLGFIISPANILTFTILFAVAGAFIAAEDTLEGAVASELVEEERRALGFGVLATANGLGDFFSSAFVSFLWSLFGFTIGFAYSAIIGTIGTLALVFTNKTK